MDNAIEASENVPEDQRVIWVDISYMKQCLLINLRNRYVGELKQKDGRLCSRKEGIGHGMGILSMEKIVGKLDGTLTIEEKGGVFCLEIWVPCSQI